MKKLSSAVLVVLTGVLITVVAVGCKKSPTEPPAAALSPVIESFSPASGEAGTSVTITGKNFGTLPSDNSIGFGSFTLVPNGGSTTRLTFVVPANVTKGMYSISVSTAGKTGTASAQFEVTKDGTPLSCNATIPVTGTIVNGCFDGNGKRNTYPRLLYANADIDRIKLLVTTDAFAKATYDDVIAKADAVLGTALLSYGLDGANLRIPNIHKFGNEQAPFLVLAYQFTKDAKYALRCWQQLDAMCSWPDWGAARHFLDAGIAAKAVAIAYDGMYNYLTTDQRNKLVTAVRNLVLSPGRTQIQTNTGAWKWYLSDDNWNGVCHGGMILAALATYESDPAFNSEVIALAANGMQRYMQSLEPDGASEEGMSYWAYGLSNAFLAYEAMKRVLSTTYGLAEQPGFVKTGWFPYLVSGPAGTATIGDDYLYNGKNNRFLSYFWFSNYFNNANLARTHYDACLAVNETKTVKMNGWMDLLFYKPELVSAGSATATPMQGYLRGIEYAFAQEAGNGDNRLYAGMHGGSNASSHGHLDAGSFFIQALGENFAVGNLGREDPYPADYFSVTNPQYNAAPTTTATAPGRYYYYRVRTEAKNCLVFNPDARPEQNPAGVATITANNNDANGAYYVLNLADCYNRDVTAYKRGLKLNRSSGIITVQDEFTPSRSSMVYWIMHSTATDGLQISADGKTATMTKNGKTCYARIAAPANASFSLVNRNETAINYLAETAPVFGTIMNGKNSINRWYGKLQIQLTGLAQGTPVTIRVDFVKTAGASVPALAPLDSWTTTN